MSAECTCYKLNSLTEICEYCEYASENCCTRCKEDVQGKFALVDAADPNIHFCKECVEEMTKEFI